MTHQRATRIGFLILALNATACETSRDAQGASASAGDASTRGASSDASRGAASDAPAMDAGEANHGASDASSREDDAATTASTDDAGKPVFNGTATLLAVGDIADCASEHDEETVALAEAIDAPVLVLGDLAYDSGKVDEFTKCYAPSWGKVKARTHPTPGNHEYNTSKATPYFDYFGEAAGERFKGYYSFDVGPWHVIALNTNIAMDKSSEQAQWLRDDLSRSEHKCTLAFMHYPRFSSGAHGDLTSVTPLWNELYDHGVDVVLAGHDHDYERFLPQDPAGNADPMGIREFVVGTGGKSLRTAKGQKNTEVVNDQTYGILKLTLSEDAYAWEYLPVSGSTFTDKGSASCH